MTADLFADLDRIRGLAAAATDGPWEADGGDISQHWTRPEPWLNVVSGEVSCGTYCLGGSAPGVIREPDAEFIAAARTDLPKLAAVVRAVLGVAGMPGPDVRNAVALLGVNGFDLDPYGKGYRKALDDIRAAATKAWEDGR